MGKRSRRGGERFVLLPHFMLRSAAWRALSPNAKAVLLHVWERHNGANNGEIVYAVRDAAPIGLSRATAARALNEAIELGFLRVTRWSAFRLKTKEAREWALTAEPIGGRPATKDFMRWTGPKSKTQSHQNNRQSHEGDSGAGNASESGNSVSPAALSAAKRGHAQSRQGDTSNIPGGSTPGAAAGQRSVAEPSCRKPPRFGDSAKAVRTARVAPTSLDGDYH